jgi:hypothetical protein
MVFFSRLHTYYLIKIFGLPDMTVFVLVGVVVIFIIALLWWGLYYPLKTDE